MSLMSVDFCHSNHTSSDHLLSLYSVILLLQYLPCYVFARTIPRRQDRFEPINRERSAVNTSRENSSGGVREGERTEKASTKNREVSSVTLVSFIRF